MDTKRNRHRNAGLKAAETKGPAELQRAARMAAWTRKHPDQPRSANPFRKDAPAEAKNDLSR